MSQEKVTIVIDGVEVKADPAHTVLQAAEAAGKYIPRLCYHPDLHPGGHCRVCTVKVNGRPQCSCTFPVAEGLVIESDTPEMNAFRRNIVEMLFVEGNHCCPSCETSGNCELQAMGYRLGLLVPTMPYLRKKRELDATHKDVYVDRDRCILCGRCVLASREVDGKHVFGFEGRGANKRIAVDGAHGLSETAMTAADKAAQVCPVGCIVVKRKGWATPVGQRKYDHRPIGSEVETKQSVG